MKKSLFGAALLLMAAVVTSCKDRHWTPEQRARLHDQIRAYREWSYIQNMNDAEFLMLADDVAATVEANYANLNAFNGTPGASDSLTTSVVGVMATYITTDARNMRYLFPYHHLVREKVLPSGLGRDQLKQFYQCMADKINNGYVSMENFLWNAMSNNVSATVVGAIQQECASQLNLAAVEEKHDHHDHHHDKDKDKTKTGM